MTVIAFINAWAGIPFVAIVMTAALKDVPEDLYEAGKVDGASPLKRFWHITLPTVAPTIGIVTALLIIYSFKAFDFIFVLSQGGPGTATSTVPFLAYLVAFTQFDFGLGSAHRDGRRRVRPGLRIAVHREYLEGAPRMSSTTAPGTPAPSAQPRARRTSTHAAKDARGWRVFGIAFLIVLVLIYGLPVFWMLSTSFKPQEELATGSWVPEAPTVQAYIDFFRTDFIPALRNSAQLALTHNGRHAGSGRAGRLRRLGGTQPSRHPCPHPVAGRPDDPDVSHDRADVQAAVPARPDRHHRRSRTCAVHPLRTVRGLDPPAGLRRHPPRSRVGRQPGWSQPAEVPGVHRAANAAKQRHRHDRHRAGQQLGRAGLPLTFLLEEDKYPLSVYIAQSVGRFNNTWNLLMTVAVMASLPVFLIVLAAQRKLQSGVTLGAVK
jgi:ABC-type glycerol-3-phosphate transport system permease component